MSYLTEWVNRWPDDLRLAVLRADPPAQHVVRVTYTHPSFNGERPLLFESGTLTLDRDAVGFAQATLTTAVPATADDLATLDPRTGTRVRIYAGYRLPGQPEQVHPVADLQLRERGQYHAAEPPTNRLTLHATTDDAMLAQSVMLEGTLDAAGLGEAMTSILDYALPGTPDVSSTMPAALNPALLEDVLPAEPGDPLWPLLVSIADLADTDVFCDPLGVWWFNYGRAGLFGNPVWTMSAKPDGLHNVISVESVRTLEQGYANVAVIRRRREDAEQVDYGIAGDPVAWQQVGQSAVVQQRTVKNLLHDWGPAARDVLRRSAQRGALVNVETPTAWWVAPYAPVLVGLPTDEGDPTSYVVERVTFDLAAGTMHVRAVLSEFAPPIS